MKKIIITFTFLVTFTSIALGQEIQDVLATIPENVFYGLDVEQRETLLSEAKDTTTIVVQDSDLYEEIRRIDYSKDFISLQTSKVGTLQIKLLPLINDSKIICVVKTVCRTICDSEIRFYTTRWESITQMELFPEPTLNWFLKNDADKANDDFENAVASLDILPIKISLSSKDNTLTAEYDIKKYLAEKDYKQLEPYVIGQPKKMIWDKVSFK